MNIAAGAFLIILPLAFNLFFFLLGRRFDYPNILRSPTEEVLRRFNAGGVSLKLLWYGFMLTAVLLATLAVLLGQVLGREGLSIVPTATVIGVLAAVVQFFGLARWPFLVPTLARKYDDPASSEATREATVVVFESFHTYLGVAIGECLGYLFTGAWTVLIGIAMLQSSAFAPWLAWPGIAIGLTLIVGAFEFVGPSEEKGWKLARDTDLGLRLHGWSSGTQRCIYDDRPPILSSPKGTGSVSVTVRDTSQVTAEHVRLRRLAPRLRILSIGVRARPRRTGWRQAHPLKG